MNKPTLLADFQAIKSMIATARAHAVHSVNEALVKLYWETGAFVSGRLKNAVWGEAVIDRLAEWLSKEEAGMRGFNRRGIYRMVQFYETYTAPAFLNLFHENRLSAALQENPPAAPASLVQISGNKEIENVSALLTQISWTNHLLILGGKRTPQERLFYLLLSCRERLSSRELKRQIDTCMFERTMASTSSMTEGLKLLPSAPGPLFRDSYSLELLGLPLVHDENELRKRIVANLKEFFLEFGRDFTFVGEEYRLQAGGHDYYCDLLLFHRELRALVAVELKAREFDPRDFGQLEFYLSVLDHDHRKPFENPSIGLLLCKEKDDAVVRYAIGHSTSPAIIAEYSRLLPDKELVRQKLNDLMGLTDTELTRIRNPDE